MELTRSGERRDFVKKERGRVSNLHSSKWKNGERLSRWTLANFINFLPRVTVSVASQTTAANPSDLK